MEESGRIIAVLEPKSGTTSAGKSWMAQTYVLEVPGDYPRRVPFEVFGEERIKEFDIKMGEEITIRFDVDGREWQGRWYPRITCFKVFRPIATPPPQPQVQAPANQRAEQYAQRLNAEVAGGQPNQSPQEKNDELPF